MKFVLVILLDTLISLDLNILLEYYKHIPLLNSMCLILKKGDILEKGLSLYCIIVSFEEQGLVLLWFCLSDSFMHISLLVKAGNLSALQLIAWLAQSPSILLFFLARLPDRHSFWLNCGIICRVTKEALSCTKLMFGMLPSLYADHMFGPIHLFCVVVVTITSMSDDASVLLI